jgi:hypothetical protein
MTKRFFLIGLICTSVVLVLMARVCVQYFAADYGYQRAIDPIRRGHVHQIVETIRDFANKKGKLPFQDKQPLMVLVGHSPEAERYFANVIPPKRDAAFASAAELEAELSKGLGRAIHLPRDPQKIPTFAPNVYDYFVANGQMTVVSHLRWPTDNCVEYKWNGSCFYANTVCYEFGTSE